ncbi:MAG: DUF167 domain-containing protein [Alphaproteobacteria bacterium]|nr:DUF167 domain-containing protein [Alphaproteobacteria bacterium]
MGWPTNCKYGTIVDNALKLYVRLSPKAKREGIEGIYDDPDGKQRIKIAVNAPPVDGKANEAVQKLIAKTLKLSKGSVSLVSGQTDRNKTFIINGNVDEIYSILSGELEKCIN